jgi:hypothetical protein
MAIHIRIGSEDHKALLCQFFIDSHVPFDPASVRWPELDDDSLTRLRSLPFWHEAVSTERRTACTIQARAKVEADPLLQQAIALQAYEEQRHANLLQDLTARYGIAMPSLPEPQPPTDPEWAFLCTGYSECFDAFFTFALFALARQSGFFPADLIEVFEPIMQEEARHILFFVNWEAYCQANRPLWQRPCHLWRGALGRSLQAWQRLQMARGARNQGEFTLKGHQALSEPLSPRRFLALCLSENERRLSTYDALLLRPRLAPLMAKILLRVLR